MSAKAYLGDSVYAERVDGMLKLTTENGYEATNTIYLEPAVWEAAVRFVNTPPEDQHGTTKTRT